MQTAAHKPAEPALKPTPRRGGEVESTVSVAAGTGWSRLATRPQTELIVRREPDPEPAPMQAPPRVPIPASPRPKCSRSIAPGDVILHHAVNPDTIDEPGDSVQITVEFACKIRGDGKSMIEDAAGTAQWKQKNVPVETETFTRTWDGKKRFPNINTYVVDDGDYRHRLDKIKYAWASDGSDLFATGPKLISPAIKVRTRANSGSGTHHFHFTQTNVDDLAEIIKSEIGVGTDDEKRTLAWAVRNQMIRLGTDSVAVARKSFGDAHNQSATSAETTIADEVLKKSMSDDVSHGAIKWFSPRSMPEEGESCTPPNKPKFDCGGGLITVTDDSGTDHRVYAPTWHGSMAFVTPSGVREWYLRFYALP